MAGILNWDLGDASSSVNSNSFSHTYASSGNKTVKIYKGTAVGAGNITKITLDNDDLVGTLDLSTLTNLNELVVNSNPRLTSIKNPTSAAIFSTYYAYDCSLNGVLDLTGLTGLRSDFQIFNNKNLSSVLFPNTSATWSYLRIENCGLTGTLDVSGLTGLGGYFMVQQNPNLQHINNPVSSQTFSAYDAYDCSLAGTLDLRSLSNIGGRIRVNGNRNLTQVKFPANAQTWSFHGIQVYNCDITGTLDVSGFSNLGGTFYAMGNPKLNKILNPTSSQSFASGGYVAYQCGLMGTLDLRTLTGLGGGVSFSQNPSLNTVLNPASSQVFGAYNAENCNLIGALDVSGFSNLGGYVQLNGNPNLQKIILPPSFNQEFWYFYGYDCSLNTTTLDDIFLKLNTFYTANAPTHTTYIYLQGTNNAWPTNSWSNTNLVGLQTAFSNAGQSLYININTEPIPLFQFKTKTLSPYTFTPVFITGTGSLDWDFGDGSLVNGTNSPSHYYSADGDRTVKVWPGTTGGAADILDINMYNENLTGQIDLSNLTGFTDLNIAQNPSINEVINPTTSTIINLYQVYLTGITGTLDMTGLTGLGGTVMVGNNSKLNHINFPASSQTFSQLNFNDSGLMGTIDLSSLTGLYSWVFGQNNPSLNNITFPTTSNYLSLYIYNNDISGNLDLSMLTGLGELRVYSNPKLTQIINPASSQAMGNYEAYNCKLTGTLDISSLSQMSGKFDVHNNSNLTKIIFANTYYGNGFDYFDLASCNLTGNLDVSALSFGWNDWQPGTYVFKTSNNSLLTSISLPTNIFSFTEFNVKNCSLNLSTVDDIFAKLNTWYSVNDPSFNLIIDAGGGGNSSPTAGWSNTDLVSIQNKFNTSPFDVSITINVLPLTYMAFTTEASTNTFDPVFTVL